ncbi:UDP-N-acetylmuramyl peptide synthase [Verrucomicrobia bacterium IMCC26134]|jgi:UDP-N-acetylmuramoyl-L-alanyl-D-glutamate--2,6-diaminopimelate ligase|nr:UDP-N-acetylmuramyl peptide synthase [Verrucomicrobia bacterium IMCC26134]
MIGYLKQNYPLIHAFAAAAPSACPESEARPRRGSADPFSRALKMAPQLSDLFSEGEIVSMRGTLERPISGLVMDSRRVVPGNVFFALSGLRTDGAVFVAEALSRGAVAIVSAAAPAAAPAKVTYVQVADPRGALARAARRIYREPDRSLGVVGVTGTNGKTTVGHLIKHFLEDGPRVGLLGTISYDLGARIVPSFKTTPEAPDIFGMLAQMRDAGCREAVMEVSSHGIDQQRVDGLEFAAAVFTNLTQDHLDYHQTLEAYFSVKTRLFTGGSGRPPPVAVINIDDNYGRRLLAMLPASVRPVSFGESADASVRAEDVELGFKETVFNLVWPEGRVRVRCSLLGRYNVSNVLAAAATAWGLGRNPQLFLPRLAAFPGVPGRMERIEEGQSYNVLVDYAHTDDALRNALGMLRAITPGRVLCVFGCGGNRDRAKRPLMTRAVEDYADIALPTADNPRNESVVRIFEDMRAGVTQPSKFTWIEDRRRAISLALDMCRPGDCLLVAGKGHETYQEFSDTITPFDDRQIVRELIALKRLRPGAPPPA